MALGIDKDGHVDFVNRQAELILPLGETPKEVPVVERKKIIRVNRWSREEIVGLLREHRLNITKVSKEFGCSRSTLYKKIKELDIEIGSIKKKGEEALRRIAYI